MISGRRRALQWFGLSVASAGCGVSSKLPNVAAAGSPPTSAPVASVAVGRPWHALSVIGDPLMDSRLLHYLGHTQSASADILECLETASRIRAGDEVSWFEAWRATAQRLLNVAKRSEKAGRTRSAGEAYLRAANYFRAALIHYGDATDPRVRETSLASAAAFERALVLVRLRATPVRIPYEGTTLPATFFEAETNAPRAPMLLVFQGWDAWPEESLHLALGAQRRGYHCLAIHAPGQGRALREQGLTFRPDFERVVTPAVDFALADSRVARDRVILIGNSFGGALAPRAAAFEHRLFACVANPGTLDWGGAIFSQLRHYGPLVDLYERDPAKFDATVLEMMRDGSKTPKSATVRWWMRATMWKHGASSPSELLTKLREFDNRPTASKIRCRTLVIDGEGEEFTPGEAKRLFDALQCPKEMLVFTSEDTGLLHCQTGAQAIATTRIFDALDAWI